MSTKRRRRAPGVVDRALDGGALQLQEAILSLLPTPHPPSSQLPCRCRDAGCLGCRGHSHLVRDDDPPEYKDLLQGAYCFVPPDPAPPRDFHRVGWSQRQIVKHVMEESNSNVLCVGYKEDNYFSPVGEALCTDAWNLLLERIGDHLMVFILRVSSIFSPLTNTSYQQLTGPCLSQKFRGYPCKRKRINNDEMPKCSYIGCIQSSHTNALEMTLNSISKSKSRKRIRVSSWQRRKKSEKITSQCCYCGDLESSNEYSGTYQINRRQIFYCTLSSCSTFPKKHILNKVKPNNSGAALLMKEVFGPSCDPFQPCIDLKGLCPGGSNCLHHYLLFLFKTLIRNVRHCNCKKLLSRHCLFPTFEKYNQDEGGCKVKETNGFSLIRDYSKLTHKEVPPSHRFSENQQLSDLSMGGEKFNEKNPTVSDSKVNLAEYHCSQDQVVSFLWAFIRRIIPQGLLGDSYSLRALRSNISKFVGLQRFEEFNLSQCLHRLERSKHLFLPQIRASKCPGYRLWYVTRNCKCPKDLGSKSSKINSFHDQLLRDWIYWLFSSVIVPVIRNCFYVTERQFQKQEVFYYLKFIWRKLTDDAIFSIKRQNYRMLDHASCMSLINKRKYGFSRVRFLPKKNKVRMLANFSAPCKVQVPEQCRSYFLKSVNSSLKELHAIMRRIKYENPNALGSSVFGYDDVYQKLHQFLQKINGSVMIPKVYIVVGDVENAFDTINQDMIIRIMSGVIEKDQYILRRYEKVSSAKGRMKVFSDHLVHDHDRGGSDVIKFEAATRLRSSSCIIIDQGEMKCISKNELHCQLAEHLKHNIVKIGRKFYLQTMGICQGSSISPLLCSFYLGHLERCKIFPYLERASIQCDMTTMNKELIANSCMLASNGSNVMPSDSCMFATDGCTIEPSNYSPDHIVKPKEDMSCSESIVIDPGISLNVQCPSQEDDTTKCNHAVRHEKLSSPEYLLMRWIDDFLFVSTSKEQAASFLRRMQRGFKDYNCEMNNKKFGLNFDVGKNHHVENSKYTGTDGIQFVPWCGLLLNCCTFEVQADYTRYLDIPISSTISVTTDDNGFSTLKAQLCNYMRPKCHPLLYDSSINSSGVVRLNAYQAFLLGAMKFHCYVCRIPATSELDPKMLLETIEQSFRFMYKLIKKQMHKLGMCFSISPVLQLKEEEIIWLGLSAYIWVLKKKQARYKKLLSLLRKKISTYGRMGDSSDSLRYATDTSHSSVFGDIHF